MLQQWERNEKAREQLLAQVKQLEQDELLNCPAFWLGNDPT